MRCYPGYRRGITTLTLLILLSGLLTVLLLFNDDILRLHSALVSQRALYVERSLHLQRLHLQQKESACQGVSLQAEGNSRVITFGTEGDDGLRHYIRCERQVLFYNTPKTGSNEGLFAQFIAQENIPIFEPHFRLPPAVLPKDRGNYFYWFGAGQTQWQLNGNIYAVVVAEGDLHISGKGRISGAVITQGRLSKDGGVQIAYRKATVGAVAQLYSRWQRAEKSWNDFTLH